VLDREQLERLARKIAQRKSQGSEAKSGDQAARKED
jgi:hypothetical protein